MKKKYPGNKDFQGVDKAPGEEKNKGEKVTTKDLKGKKVDADPSKKEDQPIDQNPPDLESRYRVPVININNSHHMNTAIILILSCFLLASLWLNERSYRKNR